MSKEKTFDYKDVHAQTVESNNMKEDVVTDKNKDLSHMSSNEIANYVIEQTSKSEEDLRQEAREIKDLPITVRELGQEKLFLWNQVNLLPQTDGYLAMREFFKMKIFHNMNNAQIAVFFNQPVQAVDMLEKQGIEDIKMLICSQPKVVL